MNQSVFVLLLISELYMQVLPAGSSCFPHSFYFIKIKKNWTEAQSYCRENYTDLATIDSSEIMKALMEELAGTIYNVNTWIGLYDSWQWSLTKEGFYSEGEAEFKNWDIAQPSGGQEYCVGMRTNGRWNDFPCAGPQTAPFICYDGDAAQPYVLISETKTWKEAQSYCRENHTDLVSVRNQTENQWIMNKFKENTFRMWIGLFRRSWKWSDQKNSSYRNWNTGEPINEGEKGNCAEVRFEKAGGWNATRCDVKNPFICYEDNLILVRQNKSWGEALSYCRKHYKSLVSVTTEQLQHWVKRRAQNASTPHVWLGLRYSCVLHFWFWVRGEGVCFQNWAPGNETQECGHTGAVESGAGQQWVSLPETKNLNFICSKFGGRSGAKPPNDTQIHI